MLFFYIASKYNTAKQQNIQSGQETPKNPKFIKCRCSVLREAIALLYTLRKQSHNMVPKQNKRKKPETNRKYSRYA